MLLCRSGFITRIHLKKTPNRSMQMETPWPEDGPNVWRRPTDLLGLVLAMSSEPYGPDLLDEDVDNTCGKNGKLPRQSCATPNKAKHWHKQKIARESNRKEDNRILLAINITKSSLQPQDTSIQCSSPMTPLVMGQTFFFDKFISCGS